MEHALNPPIGERVATLEEQNEACAIERKSHAEKIDDMRGVLLQVRGSIKTLVVLWAIATAAVSAGAVKYLFHTLAPAAAAGASV
jgi:hypothetical protein